MRGVIHAVMVNMLIFRRALFRREVFHSAVIHLRLIIASVRGMVLRSGRCGNERRAGKQQSAHQDSALSGNGRTVTTCIMPACMW